MKLHLVITVTGSPNVDTGAYSLVQPMLASPWFPECCGKRSSALSYEECSTVSTFALSCEKRSTVSASTLSSEKHSTVSTFPLSYEEHSTVRVSDLSCEDCSRVSVSHSRLRVSHKATRLIPQPTFL